MNNSIFYHIKAITFRRWSRKKGAFLVTVGITINIASLSVAIVEKIGKKTKTLVSFFDFKDNSYVNKKEKNYSYTIEQNTFLFNTLARTEYSHSAKTCAQNISKKGLITYVRPFLF